MSCMFATWCLARAQDRCSRAQAKSPCTVDKWTYVGLQAKLDECIRICSLTLICSLSQNAMSRCPHDWGRRTGEPAQAFSRMQRCISPHQKKCKIVVWFCLHNITSENQISGPKLSCGEHTYFPQPTACNGLAQQNFAACQVLEFDHLIIV